MPSEKEIEAAHKAFFNEYKVFSPMRMGIKAALKAAKKVRLEEVHKEAMTNVLRKGVTK